MDLTAAAHTASGTNWTGIAAAIAPITTLLGVLGGYWLAGRNEEARDKRADARERAARRAALAERLEEDRHMFQRDTLLTLQDELLTLMRSSNSVLNWDQRTLREGRQLGELPDDLGGAEAAEIAAAVQRSRSRLLNEHLRNEVGKFTMQCAAVSLMGNLPKDRDRALKELADRTGNVNVAYVALAELIGTHLRRELDRRILVNELDTDALAD